jgi:hypothetical protein
MTTDADPPGGIRQGMIQVSGLNSGYWSDDGVMLCLYTVSKPNEDHHKI